ncbi:MAG: GGDEF domain-containing protein [Acetatifactor sp.]|nr:GGDEF domain-containing protein [Acetatifactor sp.]
MSFHSGTATIDDQCFLIKEDDAFYNFVKLDMYAPISDCVHPEDVGKFLASLQDLQEKKMEQNVIAVRLRRFDGEYRWFMISEALEDFEFQNRTLINLKLMDVNETEAHNKRMKDRNNEYMAYLNMLGGVLIEYDMEIGQIELFLMERDRRMDLFNGSLEQFKQEWVKSNVKPSGVAIFTKMCDDIKEGKNLSEEIKIKDFSGNGKYQQYAVKCQGIKSKGKIGRVIGCMLPTSQNQNKNAIVGVDYTKDTGIDVLNKRAIIDYAKRAIRMVEDDKKVFLGIIDLDNFKIINDTLGHMFGDEVLAASAEVIKDAVGNSGMVGRIGGDELFIVVDQLAEHTEIRNLLRTIRTNIEWLYKGKRDDVNLTCSIGAACYPDHGDCYEKVFQLADEMLYRAKEKGKNRYVIYRPEIHGVTTQTEDGVKVVDNLKQDKNGILQRMLEHYLVKRNVTNEMLVTEVAYGFGLDEIQLIGYGRPLMFSWNENGFTSEEKEISYVQLSEEFLTMFDQDNLFVMNGTYNLGNADTSLQELLKAKQIESALFYKIVEEGKYRGYIMFAKKNGRSRWSENEIQALSVVGKVIALATIES